jgi:rifampicin phosphotransferase
MKPDLTRTFEAPGPGTWDLEIAHNSRPYSTFLLRPIMAGMPVGFSASAERFSLMVAGVDIRVLHGFMYMRIKPFGAPPGAAGPPPKFVFQIMTRLLPSVRRRLRGGADAFEKKIWRDELRRWDEEVKPKAIQAHRALQNQNPRPLDDQALIEHLTACERHLEANFRLHHSFNFACLMPIGDLLAHVAEWTGKPATAILGTLQGSSKISRGIAAAELEALASAIKANQEAPDILFAANPADEKLSTLRERQDEVGEAMRAYLDLVSFRCLSYDISSLMNIEVPDMLLKTIQSAVEGAPTGEDRSKQRIAELRSAVPSEHREKFDELLGEALHINRLRDERCHYSDGWATGLARRAVLEAGRRLTERGVIDDPGLTVDMTLDELCGLLRGQKTPSLEEIRARHTWRTTKMTKDDDIPKRFGPEPPPPPPVEWLPEYARRSARAINAIMFNAFVEPEPQTTTKSVKGHPVSPGLCEGTARIVIDEADFGRVQKGDVLIARATSPYFNVLLPLLGAIVTDRGGLLCHAAIVAREFGIPGVVGTRDATTVIKEGSRVRVNGDTGVVEVIG